MRASLKVILVLLAITVTVCQDNSSTEEFEKKMYDKFQKFMEKFHKRYENIAEYQKRFDIFKANYIVAKNHEKLNEDNSIETKVSMGVSEFSDLSSEEFAHMYLTELSNMTDLNETTKFYEEKDPNSEGLKFLSDNSTQVISADEKVVRNLQGVPSSWDWRSKGAVTYVKNQGSCAGCWAFCAAANIEGQLSIQRRQSISISAQQMIDCDGGNNGCNGGMMGPAFNYLQRTGGAMSWNSYPFLGYRGGCRFNGNSVVTRISGWSSAGSTNEEIIKAYLYRTGPLAITMNARNLQNYRGGIYNVPYNYCPIAPDHGVTLVGYGTAGGVNYWIIKNSWGPNWGEGGYFRIARGKSLCGVNQYVVSAKLG